MIKLNFKTLKVLDRFLLKIQGLPCRELRRVNKPSIRLERDGPILINIEYGYLFKITLFSPGAPDCVLISREFLVLDRRGEKRIWQNLTVYPASVKEQAQNIDERSAHINYRLLEGFDPPFKRIHANSAYDWLIELAPYIR